MAFSRNIKVGLAAILSFSMAVPAVSAPSYVFRYSSGLTWKNPGAPDTPVNPNQYDVTARFFGVVGDAFEAGIPTKPGARVASWRIEKGILPQGLVLDEATGTISGVPAEPVEGRTISVRGYAPSSEMGTYAQVKFDVVQVGSYARRQEAYGHTGKRFYADLATPSGVTVYAWTAVTDLPDWMAVVNGSLGGTPPQAGTWPMAFSGTDYSGKEVAYAYGQIVVEDGPQVSFMADQTRHRDEKFLASGEVKHRLGELRWEIEGDPRPAGLLFSSSTGTLQGGIPTFGTSLSFRLKAVDVDGASGVSNWFALATRPAELSLDDVPTQNLTLNKAAEFSFKAQESVGLQSWAVIAGQLPDGMSIDGSTGRVAGTPTKTGTWPGVVIQVADDIGAKSSNAFDVVVHNDGVTASVPPVSARVGVPFAGAAPSASGGIGPYSYELAAGAELPEGVSLDESTGVLSGALPESGQQAVFLVPVDSTGYAGSPFVAGLTGYSPLAVSMDRPQYDGERLSSLTISPTLAEYSAMPPANWSLSPSTVPAGMSFDPTTGVLSGIPSSVGAFGPYTLGIHDASGSDAVTEPFTVVIADVPDMVVQAVDLEIERMVETSVKAATAQHSVGSAVWTLDGSSAALPAGLSLGADGFLRGSLTATETVSGIVLKATDTEGRVAVSDPFSISPVSPRPMEMAAASLTWPAGVAFTSEIKPANPAGEWTVSSSVLPSWLSLDTATGGLSGTAPSEGTFGPYSVTAIDDMGRSATASFTLNSTGPLSASIQSPVQAHRLEAVSGVLPTVENAVGAVKWSVSGTLPKGLSFDGLTFSGVAQEEGESTVTLTARDAAGQVSSIPVTFRIGPRLPLSLAYDMPTFYAGTSSSLPLQPRQPTNAALPAAFSVTGTLPPGLSLNLGTGAVAGIPTQPGVYGGITVSALDAEGESASSGPLSFRVEPKDSIYVASPVARSMRLGSYAQTAPVTVLNAVPPLVFSTSTGSALADPDGLTLIQSNGSVAGTAATAGERSHSLKVTDSMGRSASFTLNLNVVGDLAVSMSNVSAPRYSPLPAGVYPVAENAIGSVSYTISPASLPHGVVFNPANGGLSGTPDVEGAYGPYTLTAKDASGDTAATSFTVTVGSRLALEASFPNSSAVALANNAFGFTPKAGNAVGAVTWSLQSGTLPAGLSVNPGSGRIEGVPAETGTFAGISLKATDSAGGTVITSPISITVQLDGQPIVLVTKRVTGKQGMAFETEAPTVSNEIGDVFFRSPEAVALGLSVNPATGVISGTISSPGTYVVDLNVTDTTNRVTSEPVTLDLMPRLRLTSRPIYGTVNAAMTQVRPASVDYAIGSVTYALQGTLPAGVSFSAAGYLSGTPTQLGVFENLVVTATDGVGDTASSNPFSFEVFDNGQIPTITALTPSTPALMKVGQASANVTTPSVSYGKTGDVYSVNKPLPAGLSINSVTGVVSGTPAQGSQGIFDGYVISVADTLGRGTSSGEFTIRIRSDLTPSFAPRQEIIVSGVQFSMLPGALTNGQAFVGQKRFSFASGGEGLSLNPDTGAVSGVISAGREVVLSVGDDLGDNLTQAHISLWLDGLTADKVYPVSLVGIDNQTYTHVAAWYDGSASSFATLSPGRRFQWNFAQGVAMDRFNVYLSAAGTIKLEAFVGGEWVVVDPARALSAGWSIIEYPRMLASGVRLTNVGLSTYQLGDLQCGFGSFPPLLKY